jgi:hypothetical protein
MTPARIKEALTKEQSISSEKPRGVPVSLL